MIRHPFKHNDFSGTRSIIFVMKDFFLIARIIAVDPLILQSSKRNLFENIFYIILVKVGKMLCLLTGQVFGICLG